MMFRECGGAAYGITFLALVATVMSVVALIAATQRVRGSLTLAATALGFGVLVLLSGTAGTLYARNVVDQILGTDASGPSIDPARRLELRLMGYSEALQCTNLGALASALPLALGVVALLLAIRKPTAASAL